MKRWLLFIWVVFFCSSVFGAARTEIRLVLSAEEARPGDTVWAGIEMKMPPKWHTYWRNGGDSGVPTKVEWILPRGIEAGQIQWPVPEKFTQKAGEIALVTYVYHDHVVLLAPFQVSKEAPSGPMLIQGKVSWQECEEICIQGHTEIQASLNVAGQTKPSGNAGLIEQWRGKLPQVSNEPAARASWDGPPKDDERAMVIEWTGEGTTSSVDFYPYSSAQFEIRGETEVLKEASGNVRLRKMVSKTGGDWPEIVSGLLVSRANTPERSGLEVNLPVKSDATSPSGALTIPGGAGNGRGGASLMLMLLFAAIGGLILNVMPCVLPVIALKILGFVHQSAEHPSRVRRLGLVYGLGVLVSFAIFAGLVIGVQRAGGLADWGLAFRNPQFRVLITVLVTLVALNLFGVFEVTLGGRLMGSASALSAKTGFVGAFFNGVLATVLATPCTAPFLGAATAFAFTQPPITILMVFLAIGVGLAFPFVLICWFPGMLSLMPKPGAWMERFKVAMGFPMLATAVWLFWLSAGRMGKDGVLWFGLFLVTLAFVAWLWGQFVQRGSRRRGIWAVIAVALLVFGYGYMLEGKLHWRQSGSVSQAKIEWQTWSPEAVEETRRKGHPVLVDFTADSCLNCQFNKLTSIEIEPVRKKLKEIGAVAFIADYTDENPLIGKELQRYGRGGVPLVLVYPSRLDAPPIVLPPLLTPSIVLNALEQAAK